MRVLALHPDVLVATSAIWQTNCAIVRGAVDGAEHETFLVDSPVLPEELDALPALLDQARFPVPSGLLATHGDWDHLLGRLAFPGVALGCAESTAERLRAVPGAAQRELRAFDEQYLIARPRPLALGAVQALPVPGRCAIGDSELELHRAEGHTADGMALWIPWARVLLAGDYLSAVEIPTLGSVETPTQGSMERPMLGSVEAPTLGSVETPTQGSMERPMLGSVETPTLGSVETPTQGSMERPMLGSVETPTLGSVETSTQGSMERPMLGSVETPTLGSVETSTQSDVRGALHAYIGTLQRLRPLVADALYIVPGHGPTLDAERGLTVLEEDLAYLHALDEHGVEAELPGGRRSTFQRALHTENAARVTPCEK